MSEVEQLREEVAALRELVLHKPISPTNWNKVKKAVEEELHGLCNPYRHRLQNAYAEIVKRRLKIVNLARLEDDQVEEAIFVYREVIKLAKVAHG